MIRRLTFALVLTAAGGTLLATSTPAQRHGMRGDGGFPRSGPAGHRGGGERFERGGEHHRFLNANGFFVPAYLYADNEYEQEPDAVSGPPVQLAVMQPAPPPPPVPVEPLLMEKRNGEWVRVATGKQMATSLPAPADSAKSALTATPHPAIAGRSKPAVPAPLPAAALPSAVIVFRDGHQEQIAKYVIQGDILYTNSVSANGASRERQIPLSQLDLPASLKASADRGAKFNLPSAPNEVIVRF